ncbi:MAG: hypothetical protein HYV77_02815 [Candidatus Wildermuthbacteria bacterium]|nr:hypothetical protein [Candidatus Wildermuthbacteria bacterium]
MRKTAILFIGIFAFLVSAGVLSYVLFFGQREKQQSAPKVAPIERGQSSGMGGNLYEKSNNPAAQLPDTNPFEAETNPFRETKTNPFEEGYKNPFE